MSALNFEGIFFKEVRDLWRAKRKELPLGQVRRKHTTLPQQARRQREETSAETGERNVAGDPGYDFPPCVRTHYPMRCSICSMLDLTSNTQRMSRKV